MQDAKNRHLRTIVQLCRAIYSQLRHESTIGKNLLSSNISSRCPHNMVNFGLSAEIDPVVWRTPANFNGNSRLGSVTARQSSIERQPNFAALNTGCHLCSAGRPSRWVLAHILVYLLQRRRSISTIALFACTTVLRHLRFSTVLSIVLIITSATTSLDNVLTRVCLSAWRENNTKSYGRIFTKFGE